MSHARDFFRTAAVVCDRIDEVKIEALATELAELRERGGRLFFIGVGGSAANCSHAVNDFRKLCGIEAYTPVDNVAELTAWANDEGMDHIFTGWLKGSGFRGNDALFVLSVGGGNPNVSMSIAKAVAYAAEVGAEVWGIVGRPDGFTALNGDCVLVVPQVEPQWITPLSESFQSVVWHCLVSHPLLQQRKTKW